MAPIASHSIAIFAPIETVWSVMTDLARYGEWNPFITNIAPRGAQVGIGTELELSVKWASGGGARTVEIIDRLEPPAPAPGGTRRAAMEYRFTGLLASLSLVNGSRIQEIEQSPDGPTTYRTSEAFFGLLARAVPVARVQRGFELHAQALKVRAEALVRE
jgi:hypothetical protein